MINHKEITQKSEEWHLIKWGKIGGSISDGLLNTRKTETLQLDILSQRLEEYEPFESYQSSDMERGNDLEPFAREYANEFLGVEFTETGWLQSEKNELLGISPDGLTENEETSLEIKCLNRKNHTSILVEDDIPLDKINQCIHYFTVNSKLKKHLFLAFRPEAPKHFTKILTRESIVNIGTKAKPILKTIQDCVEIAHKTADKMLVEIKQYEEKINSI